MCLVPSNATHRRGAIDEKQRDELNAKFATWGETETSLLAAYAIAVAIKV